MRTVSTLRSQEFDLSEQLLWFSFDMGGAGRLAVLCEHVLGNILLVIPDNRDIIFAIEKIIDFCRSIQIHCKFYLKSAR